MNGIFLCYTSSRTYIECVEDGESIADCLKRNTTNSWDAENWYLTCNGKLIKDTDQVECGLTYHVVPRLVGGKGGFGSMLRAIGAQIEKTTNREACRDLSGRRMRDVNNEKKLREWVSKAAEREKEKEQKRKDRWDRMRAIPKHKFEDPEYHAQKQKVLEDMEESLQVGLQKAVRTDEPSTSGSSLLGKRKAPPSAAAGSSKRSMNWIGVDLENASDLSSDDSDEENSQDSATSGGSSDKTPRNETSESTGKQQSPDEISAQPESSSDSNTVDSESNDNCVEVSNSKDHQDNSASETSEKISKDTHKIEDTQSEIEGDKVPQSEEKKGGLLSALSAVPPKQDEKQEKGEKKAEIEHRDLDLTAYDSTEALESLGLDVLKADLLTRGLKCGGTLKQRAERLWSVRGLTPDQYPANLKAKPAKK